MSYILKNTQLYDLHHGLVILLKQNLFASLKGLKYDVNNLKNHLKLKH